MSDDLDYDQAQRIALSAELHTLERLLVTGCLNDTGIEHGYRFCASPNQMTAGPLAVVRERVLARFVTALADSTGFPESYWTDRLTLDVPDDASALDQP